MKRRKANFAAPIILLLMLTGYTASSFRIRAQQPSGNARVLLDDHHDTSPPLRELVRGVKSARPAEQIEIPDDLIPQNLAEKTYVEPDPAAQTLIGPPLQAAVGLHFDGQEDDGFIPPDSNGAPGTTQFVETVNTNFSVYDKTNGQLLLGPYPINSTLFKGFSGECESGPSFSDPTVRYDRAAARWVIEQFAAYIGFNPPYFQCIAVSVGPDATGSYHRYAIPFGNDLPDYPKLGVWPDAYYLSADLFQDFGYYIGVGACALERAAMLQGRTAKVICLQTPGTVFQLLPSDLDGSAPPPAGSPNYYVGNLLASTNSIDVYRFHVDFLNPARSALTGPTRIAVAPYTPACPFHACIPQPGTSQQLDSLGQFAMYRLAYRNFANLPSPGSASYQSLLLAHSILTETGSVATRWYELRASENGDFQLFQQGTFAPDSNFRWTGSLAADKAGNLALGYSISSPALFPSIKFTGRTLSDPPGVMESEGTIELGSGSQEGGSHANRWGDYSSMAVDPVDDCTFWFTSEYLATAGTHWKTHIASLKFPGCR